MVPAPNSPEFLAGQARGLFEELGYTEPPADRAYGFFRAGAVIVDWIQENLDPQEFRELLAGGRPSMITFWYRQSPRDLVPINARSVVGPTDPPLQVSGMAEALLDLEGRLRLFSAVPPQVDSSSTASEPTDWQPLFDAAGLDRSQWIPSEPEYVPAMGFDERAAWTGVYPEAPSLEMRIQAAAWNGRPVLFRIDGPRFTPQRQVLSELSSGRRAARLFVMSLVLGVMTGAALLAWLNHRRGRGDLGGATRLAAFAFGVWLIQWFLLADHVPLQQEISNLGWAFAEALYYGGLLWVLYMAVEPYVRRRWP